MAKTKEKVKQPKQKTESIDILKPIKKLSKRFHLTMFFVFIVACLSGAILLINKTIQDSPADTAPTASAGTQPIDQATLNRINSLHTSAEGGTPAVLPAGRTNPFGE